MRLLICFFLVPIFLLLFSSFHYPADNTYPLTIQVKGLRNTKGVVQFTLYNSGEKFPDELYKYYYRNETAYIINGVSTITFEKLPDGRYAIKVMHDENCNGIIDKKFFLPAEGIGFSNYKSIGLSNRPTFEKAAFSINEKLSLEVKMIYL